MYAATICAALKLYISGAQKSQLLGTLQEINVAGETHSRVLIYTRKSKICEGGEQRIRCPTMLKANRVRLHDLGYGFLHMSMG